MMRCSLSVQAAGPRRRRSVFRRDRSGGTRPLRRLQERSQRASSAASSWSQLTLPGIAGGPPVPPGPWGAPRPGGAGSPPPGGPTRGAVASPAEIDPWWDSLGRLLFLPRGRRVVWRLGGGAAGHRGRATETSLPVLGGCGRPFPCLLPGRRGAPRATPGGPALPQLCRACLHIGGILWILWPPSLEGAVRTCG